MMDALNEAPFDPTVTTLLQWIKVMEVCVGGLLVLALLIVVVGLLQHVSWQGHLWVALPLAASIMAAMVIHHFHDTYLWWEYVLGYPPYPNWSFPYSVAKRYLAYIASSNQAAETFGWVIVGMTGIVWIVSLLRVWRLVSPEQHRQQSASLALES